MKRKLKYIMKKYFIFSRLRNPEISSKIIPIESQVPLYYKSASSLIEIPNPSKQVKGIVERYFVGYHNEETDQYFNTGYKIISGKYLFSITKNKIPSKYYDSYQYIIIIEKIDMHKRLSFHIQMLRDDIELLQTMITEENNKINLLLRLKNE